MENISGIVARVLPPLNPIGVSTGSGRRTVRRWRKNEEPKCRSRSRMQYSGEARQVKGKDSIPFRQNSATDVEANMNQEVIYEQF
jgi:hypothetical protein